jgi:hypothetical protein
VAEAMDPSTRAYLQRAHPLLGVQMVAGAAGAVDSPAHAVP